MITQTPWLERSFNFDFPAGLYPGLLERLRGTPARVEEMVYGIDELLLCRKPDSGWSVKEQMGHLTDLESLHEGRLDDFIAGKQMLRAADMSNKETHAANHNDKPTEILLQNFRRARMTFISKLENADESLVVSTSIHPRLQSLMRMVDMVYFICEHDDHHLARIRSLILNPTPSY